MPDLPEWAITLLRIIGGLMALGMAASLVLLAFALRAAARSDEALLRQWEDEGQR